MMDYVFRNGFFLPAGDKLELLSNIRQNSWQISIIKCARKSITYCNQFCLEVATAAAHERGVICNVPDFELQVWKCPYFL